MFALAGPRAADAQSPATVGTIVSGEVPANGFGLFVFGGGDNGQLTGASGCEATTARFWATDDGDFIVFIPSSTVQLVNAGWNALFADGIPAGTVLIGTCGGALSPEKPVLAGPNPPDDEESAEPTDGSDGGTSSPPASGGTTPPANSDPGTDPDIEIDLDAVVDALNGIDLPDDPDGLDVDALLEQLGDLQDLLDQLGLGGTTP